jgi:peptide/nickel transport system substrate-binding protein
MSSGTSKRAGRAKGALRGAAAVLAVGVVLAACGSSPSSSSGSKGGSIYFAEAPGANPNYIFPYMGCKYFSVATINQFQFEMYRPVYWFGLGNTTAVQYPLSLANAPVFSNNNKTITVTMKGWKFSDGQTVNAESVMFFLNMYKADPTSYCGYNKGFGIPDQVSTATGTGNNVTINFSKPVSPNWILYNYLSELSAMPEAWDKTSASAAAGTGHCATGTWGAASTNSACKAVEKFLDNQSLNTSTYTNSMWQTVDGPFKLTSFDTLGNATLVPNTKYSGPQKAQVDNVFLKSYTTASAEQSDLYANKLTIGYVDPSVLPGPAPSPGAVGPNVAILSGKYNIMTGTPWSFNYAPINFSPSDPKSAELSQLYIRQALQMSVNQAQIVKSVNKNYGVITCSPIPPNTPSSISATISCQYPYNLVKAKALLTVHGWSVVNGVQTCEKPGTSVTECGSGIAKGSTLNFAFIWQSGTPATDQTLNAEIAAWKTIGISFSHSEASFNDVIAQCNGGTFQLCMWGQGWIYAPDYYPSGETLFTPGGSFNPGSYKSNTMNALVTASVTQKVPLTNYGKFAATDLPVLYEPNSAPIAEFSTKLKGVTPLNPLQNFMPEYLYF